MTTSQNGNDYERLKEELRRLKRRGAPWYFESALHQRLQGSRKGRGRLRPISTTPVIVVAVVTLCILALVTYVFFVRTNLFPAGSPTRTPVAADTLSHVQEPAPVGYGVHENHPAPGENSIPAPRTAPVVGRAADTAFQHAAEPVRDDTVARAVHTMQRMDTTIRRVPQVPAVAADTSAGRSAPGAARRDTTSKSPDTTGRPSPVRPPQ